jgi:hypothetical protein
MKGMNDSLGCLEATATLLVEIAGPEPVHIEMSKRGPKKYYDVHRPFDERDARAHLAGWKTKGASLRYPVGMTRALCYDADTPDDWQLLQEAARELAGSGYVPLLEVSPAGRGGHLWIIYTNLVYATWARQHVIEHAPWLAPIAESWPGTGARARKVRLPGGKYVQPGFSQWCMLTDAYGISLSRDGSSAASVLLAYQSPTLLVPAYHQKPDIVEHESDRNVLSDAKTQAQHLQRTLGQVDSHWREKYSRLLWFQFTPRQLAALYNERHPLQDMLQREPGDMAFSPSVQERTPSTAMTKDGRAWVDFSAQSLQHDGKHDGGDALELLARHNGETKESKSGTLQEIARDLVREAKDTLEKAAISGELPPSWVASIMTEAGWQHYHRLRTMEHSAAQTVVTPSRGVTGFDCGESTQALREPVMQGVAQRTDSEHAVPNESVQVQETPEMLATDIGTHVGEPCSRCGCTLSYQSGPYQMCHQCYPRPAKFGRLTDEQWWRLRALFPRKPAWVARS